LAQGVKGAPDLNTQVRKAAPAKESGAKRVRTMVRGWRTIALLSFLVLALGLLSYLRPLKDFVEYWTAAHLSLNHQNPYSIRAMMELQKPLGWAEPLPLMFLDPPWVLPFVLPFRFLGSYPLAWSIWILAIAASLVFSSRILLNIYAEDVKLPEISDTPFLRGLFIFSFYPALLCLRFAKTTPLMLLGLAGFIWFHRRNKLIAAGLSLSLVALKPNLVYLVLLALVLTRSWRVIASSGFVVAALSCIALLMDRGIFSEYFGLIRSPYMALYPSALGWVLRLPFSVLSSAWMQWLPVLGGLIWFVVYWRRHRGSWSWEEQMPILLTVSLLTTSYARLYDQVLLAIPVVYLFGRYVRAEGVIARRYIAIYTAVNFALIAGAMVTSPFAYPIAPIAFCCLLLSRTASRTTVQVTA
jgi:hypothetical protein